MCCLCPNRSHSGSCLCLEAASLLAPPLPCLSPQFSLVRLPELPLLESGHGPLAGMLMAGLPAVWGVLFLGCQTLLPLLPLCSCPCSAHPVALLFDTIHLGFGETRMPGFSAGLVPRGCRFVVRLTCLCLRDDLECFRHCAAITFIFPKSSGCLPFITMKTDQ